MYFCTIQPQKTVDAWLFCAIAILKTAHDWTLKLDTDGAISLLFSSWARMSSGTTRSTGDSGTSYDKNTYKNSCENRIINCLIVLSCIILYTDIFWLSFLRRIFTRIRHLDKWFDCIHVSTFCLHLDQGFYSEFRNAC